MYRQEARKRRAKKARAKINELDMPCLCVYRTLRHIYVQLIMPNGKVAASVSTLGTDKYGGNVQAAVIVGQEIAARVKKLGIIRVAFDRSGFKYHGRIKALADAAREHGLEF